MKIGLLSLHIRLAGSQSLKSKRGRLKPLFARLQRKFNISVAEISAQDKWSEAVIACALVSNDHGHANRSLQKIVDWIENNWPDVEIIEDKIEIIQ